MKYVTTALLLVIAIALMVIAYGTIHWSLNPVQEGAEVKTSYENIVIVLLSTVTIIFTISAVVIAFIGLIGPRTIKKEAGKYAENAVLESIQEAMKSNGKAAKLLEDKFPPNDGPVKDWLEDRIERQVITLLPLIMDRMGLRSDVGPVDPKEPEDEGTVD